MILSVAEDQNIEARAEGKRGHESVYADTQSKEHSRPQYLLELQKREITTCSFCTVYS